MIGAITSAQRPNSSCVYHLVAGFALPVALPKVQIYTPTISNIYEGETVKRTERQFPLSEAVRLNDEMRALVRIYFGRNQIKGRRADDALIFYIADTLRTKDRYIAWRKWIREFPRAPESWGFYRWAVVQVFLQERENTPAPKYKSPNVAETALGANAGPSMEWQAFQKEIAVLANQKRMR